MNIFDREYKKYDAWYERNQFAYLSELEALKKVVPKNKTGLEIGVGTGRFSAPLHISAGIDPSFGMLKIARQRGVNVYQGFGEDLPFADGVFDYAVMINTLCFVHDPIKVLEESWRVLKDQGELIIGFIDKDSFLGRFYQKKKSEFYKAGFFLSTPDVVEMLQKTGFNQNGYNQTISVFPEEMTAVETVKKGFGEGCFVVVHSSKKKRM